MRKLPGTLAAVFLSWFIVAQAGAPAAAVELSTLKIQLTRIESGFSAPTTMAIPDDGSDRIFVGEQAGLVRVRRANGSVSTFLDIRSKVNAGGERGLLGIAFHPDYRSNGYVFVAYTDGEGALVVARFRASPPDAGFVSAGTETTIITVPHPGYGNHNGGQIAFGPDGHLYIGTGDGGGGGDPDENAQDRTKLLGKILRLDVNRTCGSTSYCIPPSNPYATSSTFRKEIWQYGLRNPWRFSFDRSDGALWIGDVGQSATEEINRIEAGAGGRNFGWDCFEGSRAYEESSGCPAYADTVHPVTEYDQSRGDCAVIGGFVYRGARYRANMGGVYLYSDNCTGYVRAYAGGSARILLKHSGSPTSFGQDPSGELYLVDGEGSLYRVTAQGGVSSTAMPTTTAEPSPSPTLSERAPAASEGWPWWSFFLIGLAMAGAAAVAVRKSRA